MADGCGYVLHDLAGLPAEMLPQAARLYAGHGWGEADAFDLSAMAAAFRSGLGVCAMADGQLLGWARGFSDGWQCGWLAEIIVRRDCEGAGIGGALAREFIARCGAGHVYCEALAGREPFFERLGFQLRPRLSAMSWRR